MPDIRAVKQSYFRTVGCRPNKFIGVQPKTLCKEDLGVLSDDWRYLVKYDGERRRVYVTSGECYLIDRNHWFEWMRGWGACLPRGTTLVLDGELLSKGGKAVMKIFDVMHLNGRNVEGEDFVSRMSLLSEYWLSIAGVCCGAFAVSRTS